MRHKNFFSCFSGTSLVITTLLVAPSFAEKIPFKQVITLALENSGTAKSLAIDDLRAYQGYLEARNAFVPQINLGSGLAYSIGFPLGPPSVFTVASQSPLWNPAQRDFVKSAHSDWLSSKTNSEDKRRQLILDTALAYIELDKALTSFGEAQRHLVAATQFQSVIQQRVEAGVENQLEVTRSKLNAARVKLHLAEIQTTIDTLRAKLAQMTGLTAADIDTDAQSIPKPPSLSQEAELSAKALLENPAIEAANQEAIAKAFRATAEKKQLRPAVDLIGQYQLFTHYNNYDEFYRKFSRNNFALGVSIRVPFLNLPQNARAAGAKLEAAKAQRDLQAVKEQVSSETLRLQRVVQQLQATQEVAQLEYDLAKSDVDTTAIRVQTGGATVKDQGTAEAAANEKYATLADTTFELQKAQLQLLRAAGDIENWAIGSPK